MDPSTASLGADTFALMAQNLPFVIFFAGWVWITRKQDDARAIERDKTSQTHSTEIMNAWKTYFSGERMSSDKSYEARAQLYAASLDALGTSVEHTAETMSSSLELVAAELAALRGEQSTLTTELRNHQPRSGGR